MCLSLSSFPLVSLCLSLLPWLCVFGSEEANAHTSGTETRRRETRTGAAKYAREGAAAAEEAGRGGEEDAAGGALLARSLPAFRRQIGTAQHAAPAPPVSGERCAAGRGFGENEGLDPAQSANPRCDSVSLALASALAQETYTCPPFR